MKFPPDRARDALVIEMAFSLYQRTVLSMGNARKLSGLDKCAFIDGLAERKVERHYSEQDLLDDIEYANGEQFIARNIHRVAAPISVKSTSWQTL